MARLARIVILGLPHHVTQRGNKAVQVYIVSVTVTVIIAEDFNANRWLAMKELDLVTLDPITWLNGLTPGAYELYPGNKPSTYLASWEDPETGVRLYAWKQGQLMTPEWTHAVGSGGTMLTGAAGAIGLGGSRQGFGSGNIAPTRGRRTGEILAKRNVSYGTGRTASGDVKFTRWKRGDAIDKPMSDGSAPSWKVVRDRYWKNRHDASMNTGEFSRTNLRRMHKGNAPQDFNTRTWQMESRELHHHAPQRFGGQNVHNPFNLREVTPDQHALLDPFRRL